MRTAQTLEDAISVLSTAPLDALPAPVLRKTSETDPMRAANASGIELLRNVLANHVSLGLFDIEVIERAAVYSGGVLRTFFRLLRCASIRAADLYALPIVDASTFNDQLEDERNKLVRITHAADRAVLAEIHHHHVLPERDAFRLLATSLVIEYDQNETWWEANPLLWHLLM